MTYNETTKSNMGDALESDKIEGHGGTRRTTFCHICQMTLSRARSKYQNFALNP